MIRRSQSMVILAAFVLLLGGCACAHCPCAAKDSQGNQAQNKTDPLKNCPKVVQNYFDAWNANKPKDLDTILDTNFKRIVVGVNIPLVRLVSVNTAEVPIVRTPIEDAKQVMVGIRHAYPQIDLVPVSASCGSAGMTDHVVEWTFKGDQKVKDPTGGSERTVHMGFPNGLNGKSTLKTDPAQARILEETISYDNVKEDEDFNKP